MLLLFLEHMMAAAPAEASYGIPSFGMLPIIKASLRLIVAKF
jgi:hypothetical protein